MIWHNSRSLGEVAFVPLVQLERPAKCTEGLGVSQSLTQSLAEMLTVRVQGPHSNDREPPGTRVEHAEPHTAQQSPAPERDLLALSDVDLARQGLSRGVLALRSGA